MKKFLAAAAAVSLIAFAAPAFAQTTDGSINYNSISADNVTLGTVSGNISWKSSTFVGLEGEVGFGVKDDTVSGVDVEANTVFGGYVTANADLSENSVLFARVGYVNLDAETSSGIDLGDSGLAYGVGGKFFLDGKNGIRLDYTRYNLDDDVDVWSIGYVRRFN